MEMGWEEAQVTRPLTPPWVLAPLLGGMSFWVRANSMAATVAFPEFRWTKRQSRSPGPHVSGRIP